MTFKSSDPSFRYAFVGRLGIEVNTEFGSCDGGTYLEDHPSGCKWLVIMVSKSPK